jgi:hypothetical protein
MQKSFLFPLLVSFIFLNACNQSHNQAPVATSDSTKSVNIFPVTSFLKAQLRALDTLPVTPLQILTWKEKKDSSWLDRKDIRKEAAAFLSPEIDSSTMHSLFTEKSFLDQTINAYTFSYDPKTQLPDSVSLKHWDVYMNPQTNLIERIYIVKEKDSANKSMVTQLTWMVNKWYSIRTITQTPGKDAEVKEKKMIWNFDD